jgi:hypothetical protein
MQIQAKYVGSDADGANIYKIALRDVEHMQSTLYFQVVEFCGEPVLCDRAAPTTHKLPVVIIGEEEPLDTGR